jgi:hypothetical protein
VGGCAGAWVVTRRLEAAGRASSHRAWQQRSSAARPVRLPQQRQRGCSTRRCHPPLVDRRWSTTAAPLHTHTHTHTHTRPDPEPKAPPPPPQSPPPPPPPITCTTAAVPGSCRSSRPQRPAKNWRSCCAVAASGTKRSSTPGLARSCCTFLAPGGAGGEGRVQQQVLARAIMQRRGGRGRGGRGGGACARPPQHPPGAWPGSVSESVGPGRQHGAPGSSW